MPSDVERAARVKVGNNWEADPRQHKPEHKRDVIYFLDSSAGFTGWLFQTHWGESSFLSIRLCISDLNVSESHSVPSRPAVGLCLRAVGQDPRDAEALHPSEEMTAPASLRHPPPPRPSPHPHPLVFLSLSLFLSSTWWPPFPVSLKPLISGSLLWAIQLVS